MVLLAAELTASVDVVVVLPAIKSATIFPMWIIRLRFGAFAVARDLLRQQTGIRQDAIDEYDLTD